MNKNQKRNSRRKTRASEKFAFEFFFIKNDKAVKYLPIFISTFYFLVLFVLAFTYHKIGDYGVETDFYEGFVYEAKEFLKGNLIIEGYKGPLYPIVLAIFSFILGDYFKVGVFISVISAAVFLYFSFKTLEKIFGFEVALGSVLLILSNSIFIQYSYSAGTDLFFCSLAILSIYFLIKGDNLKYSSIFISGIFASLAFLTRTNGLFLPAAAVVSFLIFKFSSKSYRVLIKHVFTYLAGFILLNIPWSYYKYIKTGDPFYDRNFTNTAWELYGKGKMSWDYFQSVEVQKFQSMRDVILRDPAYFFQEILVKNFYQNFLGDLEKLLSLPLSILLVLGIFFLFKRKYKKNEVFFLLNILFAFLILLPAFYSERFSLFLLVGYSAIVMLLLTHSKFKDWKIGKVSIGLVVFMIAFILSIAQAFSHNSKWIDAGPQEVLRIAEVIPDSIKNEKNLLVARKPHAAYYFNMSYYKFPYVTTYDSLISWIKSKNAKYFFVSTFELQTLLSYTKSQTEQKKFYYLIDPSITKKELKFIAYTYDPPSVLYEIIY